jgi:hypothetical protein
MIPIVRMVPFCALMLLSGPAQSGTVCAASPFQDPPEISDMVARTTHAVDGFESLTRTLSDTIQEICISDQLYNARGYFEPDTRRIVLASGMPEALALAVMVHELRHAEQFELGLCPSLSLGMKDYAQGVFAMEADASVTNLVVAAHLRDNGEPEMWIALSRWPMQADIARVFDTTLRKTGDVSQAAHSAFDAWFADDTRTNAYYVASCLDYLEETEREHLLPQYDRIPKDFLTRLCTLPDGKSYDCALSAVE